MRKGFRGFTLPELLVSLGVMMTMAVSLVSIFSQSKASTDLSATRMRMSELGAHALSRISPYIVSAFGDQLNGTNSTLWPTPGAVNFTLSLTGLLATAYLRLLPVRLQLSTSEQSSLQGQYAAEAALLQLVTYYGAGLPLDKCPRSLELPAGWSGQVTSVSPVMTVQDTKSKYVRIRAEGRQAGRVRRKLSTTIQLGPPLTNYSLYLKGFDAGGNKFAAFPYGATVNGPVYCEGEWRVQQFSRSSTAHTSTSPMVNGMVFATQKAVGSVAPDGAAYVNGDLPYNQVNGAGVADPAQYAKLYKDGLSGIKANADEYDLKLNNTTTQVGALQKFLNATWGTADDLNVGVDNLPTSADPDGVYLNTDGSGNPVGGVYVKGDVLDMVLTSVNANGQVDTTSAPSNVNPATELTFATSKILKRGNKQISVDKLSIVDVKSGYNLYELGNGQQKIYGSILWPDGSVTQPAPGSQPTAPPGSTVLKVGTGSSAQYIVYGSNTNGMIYVNGNLGVCAANNGVAHGIRGTIQGQKTIVATGDLIINGDILKYDADGNGVADNAQTAGNNPKYYRGITPTSSSVDMLGLAKGDSEADTRLDIQIGDEGDPAPSPGYRYYVYANLLGMGTADIEGLHGVNGSFIPKGGILQVVGQIAQTAEVAGHIKQFFDFFGAARMDLTLDPAGLDSPPPNWPTLLGVLFLQSYVDETVAR